MLKGIITSIKANMVYILDLIIPKNDKIILFSTNGGNAFNGHPKSIFNYIKENHPEYTLYVVLTRNGFTKDLDPQHIIYNNTIKTALILIRAKYLVGSHLLRDFRPFKFSKRKTYVQTWHGSGTKKFFFAMGNVFDKKAQAPKKHLDAIKSYGDKITFFISPSELISAIYCRSFSMDSRKMIATGQPSTDDLIYKKKTKILKNIIPDLPEYKKVILYATTFRRTADVTETYPVKYFPFDDMDFDDLDKFLEENKILILIRDHLSTGSVSNLKRERVVSLNANLCPDIYDIFPETDLLITDWSGVSHEFYPLQKPVMHILYDEKEYIKDPGIQVDDYTQWTPGYRPKTYESFKEDIYSSLFVNDEYLEQRNNIYKQLFPKQDGNSAKRIFEYMTKGKID